MQTLELYICSKSRPYTTLRRNQKPREAPETRHRGLNALAHPNTSPLSCRGDRPIAPLARQEGCGTSERRHLLISPGPVSLPCPPGDGKTPWIEPKQTGHPPPRDRLGGRTVANLRYIKIGVAGRQTPHESSSLGGWPVGELTPHQIKHRGSWGGQDPWLRHVIELPGANGPITGPHCALRRLGAGQGPAVCPNSRSTKSSIRVRPAAIRPAADLHGPGQPEHRMVGTTGSPGASSIADPKPNRQTQHPTTEQPNPQQHPLPSL